MEDQLTFGQKAVGLTFNPSGDENVTQIKKIYASVIDLLNDIRTANAGPTDQNRLIAIAITQAQDAQMWAVKAVTWKN